MIPSEIQELEARNLDASGTKVAEANSELNFETSEVREAVTRQPWLQSTGRRTWLALFPISSHGLVESQLPSLLAKEKKESLTRWLG